MKKQYTAGERSIDNDDELKFNPRRDNRVRYCLIEKEVIIDD